MTEQELVAWCIQQLKDSKVNDSLSWTLRRYILVCVASEKASITIIWHLRWSWAYPCVSWIHSIYWLRTWLGSHSSAVLSTMYKLQLNQKHSQFLQHHLTSKLSCPSQTVISIISKYTNCELDLLHEYENSNIIFFFNGKNSTVMQPHRGQIVIISIFKFLEMPT